MCVHRHHRFALFFNAEYLSYAKIACLFPDFDRQPKTPLPRLLGAEGSMAYERKSRKTAASEGVSHDTGDQGVPPDLETTIDRRVSSAATPDRMQRPTLDDNWPSQPAVTVSELNVIESFFSELVDDIIKR